jgi:hypothetical protein
MIKKQIINTIDEIQDTLAKLAVQEIVSEKELGPQFKETKSYGKRRKIYKAKGDLTAAARELASPEGIDIAKAKAYVHRYWSTWMGPEKRIRCGISGSLCVWPAVGRIYR